MDYIVKVNANAPLCVQSSSIDVTVQNALFCYRGLPKAHSSESRHHIHDNDGDLHLCHVDPVKKLWG